MGSKPKPGNGSKFGSGEVWNLDQRRTWEESFSGNSSCLVGNVAPNLVQTPFLQEELVDFNCIGRKGKQWLDTARSSNPR